MKVFRSTKKFRICFIMDICQFMFDLVSVNRYRRGSTDMNMLSDCYIPYRMLLPHPFRGVVHIMLLQRDMGFGWVQWYNTCTFFGRPISRILLIINADNSQVSDRCSIIKYREKYIGKLGCRLQNDRCVKSIEYQQTTTAALQINRITFSAMPNGWWQIKTLAILCNIVISSACSVHCIDQIGTR